MLDLNKGSNRIVVNELTASTSEIKASLLEERLDVNVGATVKGRERKYDWIAKVLRAEAGPANYARFQGLLETEVNFYADLIPDLNQLGAPMPRTFPFLWGDYKTLNREVLLLERQAAFDVATTIENGNHNHSNPSFNRSLIPSLD